jgi:hypothetical protein
VEVHIQLILIYSKEFDMKKIFLLTVVAFIMMISSAFATWTLVPVVVSRTSHYLTWKVICTSDGSSLTATDLVALMSPTLRTLVQSSSMMIMKVSPGTGSVIPDTTIDVTLSDAQGTSVFVHAAYSNVADTTGISLAEDFNQYLPVHDKFYLTLNDIGTAGDQVTLYFECWID